MKTSRVDGVKAPPHDGTLGAHLRDLARPFDVEEVEGALELVVRDEHASPAVPRDQVRRLLGALEGAAGHGAACLGADTLPGPRRS